MSKASNSINSLIDKVVTLEVELNKHCHKSRLKHCKQTCEECEAQYIHNRQQELISKYQVGEE